MLSGILWFIFIAAALLLSLTILIQEGKGGGLGEAFGGMGQETFGAGNAGVNKVTASLAAAFLLSSILIVKLAENSTANFGSSPDTGNAPGVEQVDGGAGESNSGEEEPK